MSVKRTDKLLRTICKEGEGKSRKVIASIQQDQITKPLAALFPDTPTEAIYYELLQNGLFEPMAPAGLMDIIVLLEKKELWTRAKKEYSRLKKLWNGPEADIYIYPLAKRRPSVDGITANKNGVAYKNALFLFVDPELTDLEFYALLAHEYHHICRISYLGSSPAEHSLKESLVIEGMAEVAVEELYGEKWLSPWAQRYTEAEAKKIWRRHFVTAQHIKGVGNHRPYLYGDRRMGLPLWCGYSTGYRLVKSYLQHNAPISQETLYQLSADAIIEGSGFS